MFFTNHDGLNNLGRGSPKEHLCQVILKSVQWFLTRRFFSSFLYRNGENKLPCPCPPPPTPPPPPPHTHTHTHTHSWRPCFLTNHESLNNLGRGYSKEHFCQIILKSLQCVLTQRLLKVFLLVMATRILQVMATRILHGFQIFEKFSGHGNQNPA